MSDDDKTLVEWLGDITDRYSPYYASEFYESDAEKARQVKDRIEAQAAEIARLRKVLESVLAHRYGDWCDIARAALGEQP